jgi:hypothetical protein
MQRKEERLIASESSTASTEPASDSLSSSSAPSQHSTQNHKPRKPKDPAALRRYEETRRANNKRGYACNLRKHQQTMLKSVPADAALAARLPPPDYPGAINSLLDALSSSQPSADKHKSLSFSSDSLMISRARINQQPNKIWRVWLPEHIKCRFLLFKSLYAPEGTTVAEFAEMLLAFKRRRHDGTEDPGGLNLSLLESKTVTELPVDVST